LVASFFGRRRIKAEEAEETGRKRKKDLVGVERRRLTWAGLNLNPAIWEAIAGTG
jgi:hypothetical protein